MVDHMIETTYQRIKFEEAEFYPTGYLATITGPLGTWTIERMGTSCLPIKDKVLVTPDDFRDAFPDGKMMDVVLAENFEFEENGWFEVVPSAGTPHGSRISMMQMSSALNCALNRAFGWGVEPDDFDTFIRNGD